jgi:hypothetical protein
MIPRQRIFDQYRQDGLTGAGDLVVQHKRRSDRGVRRRSRWCALHAALAIAALLVQFGAQAQTTLPDINVIATTPLSGTGSTARSKPQVAARASRPHPGCARRAGCTGTGRTGAGYSRARRPCPAGRSGHD